MKQHPTDKQPCQAQVRDAEVSKALGFDSYKPCRHSAIAVRGDYGHTPRLVCGLHAKAGAVRWQQTRESRFIYETRLSRELLAKVLMLRYERETLCRETMEDWKQAVREAVAYRLATERHLREK